MPGPDPTALRLLLALIVSEAVTLILGWATLLGGFCEVPNNPCFRARSGCSLSKYLLSSVLFHSGTEADKETGPGLQVPWGYTCNR